ncbi:MAG: protoporphyrinogen oxidase [Coriobacteriia bacterium]|nr:protoporphyrinogen oxidase [Coriobacteriia bacterium]
MDVSDTSTATATEAAETTAVQKPRHVVIIGAGIAGLGAALSMQRAQDAGHPVTYEVFESDARVGGQLWTDRPSLPGGGTAIADGGSDSFLSSKTPPMARVARSLGIADEICGTDDSKKKTFIVKGGKLVPLPDGIMMFAPTKILPMATTKLYSWPAKFRMALDIVMPRKKRAPGQDEAIGSLVRRRLGNECLDRLAEPLVGGINGSDPDTMSTLGTYPMLLEMEEKYGSLILGFLNQRKTVEAMKKKHPPQPGKPARTFFSSCKQGLDDFTNHMAEKLGEEHVHTSTPVTGIERTADGRFIVSYVDETDTNIIRYSGIQHDAAGNMTETPSATDAENTVGALDSTAELEGNSAHSAARTQWRQPSARSRAECPLTQQVTADAVIITAPAWVAGELMQNMAPEACEILSNIPHSSCATIITAWDEKDAPFEKDWHGILAPGIEKQPVTGISLISSKWPGRAPEGTVLMRGFVGGARDDHSHSLPDEELIQMVKKAYVELLGLAPDAQPTYAKVFRFPRAMPQYIVGHIERMDALNSFMKQQQGLAIGGAAYTGVGVPNCMESGESAAEKILSDLGLSDED